MTDPTGRWYAAGLWLYGIIPGALVLPGVEHRSGDGRETKPAHNRRVLGVPWRGLEYILAEAGDEP